MSVTSTSKKDAPGQSDQDGAAAAKRAAQPGLAAFVGTGPGSAELLTVRAAGLLGRADLVFATGEVADRVRHLIPAGAQVRDRSELDADPRLLVKAVKAGQLVVAAYDGDPLLFGSAAGGAAACARARVRFEIVPGMPAATAVPAYAGIPLTSDSGGDIRIVHAAEVSRLSAETQPPRSLVILGVEAGPADLAKMLMAGGWPDRTPFTITWNGTTTEQLTIRCALGSVSA
ncbi:MAG TPA: SAM-dependent methyltransferase, partial [Streptosporangiaceae bacterium]|nr:SAM-dependent methyltransferase [Streptosporangiaceae bacterium]